MNETGYAVICDPLIGGDPHVLPPVQLQEGEIDLYHVQWPDNTNINLPLTQPISPRGPPDRTVFSGNLNFIVEIKSSDTHKKKYLFSHLLNRLYVDMNCNFTVHFRWDHINSPSPMYVRATTIFSDESQAENRVERCLQHAYDKSNEGVSKNIVQNVLRSASDVTSQGVHYCGEPALRDSWYSVLVELPTNTNGMHARVYQFVCKNSCSSGINRRTIDIIFNLEDHLGNVYGRQSVGARVCSCLRRDMLKDQEEGAPKKGKRPLAPPPELKPKKVKIENVPAVDDDQLITLPPLQLVGIKNTLTGLGVILSMMEQASALKKNDPQAVDKYNQPIASLKSYIDELKKSRPQ